LALCSGGVRAVVTHSAQGVVKATRRVGRLVWPASPDAA